MASEIDYSVNLRRGRCPWGICVAALLGMILGGAARALGGDWEGFRGGKCAGMAEGGNWPVEWVPEKNVKWVAELPASGNGSPIVSKGKVFVCCAEDRKGHGRSVYCFDRASGKKLWVKTVRYEKEEPTHAQNPYCATTPAADGERVVVWHGSAGLYCYDYEGKELWNLDLGSFGHIWGYGSSPVIFGESVIVNCGPGARSFVVAVDKKSGKILWQTEEPGGADDTSAKTRGWLGSWATPVIAKVGGQEQVLVAMPFHLNAYEPGSGKILWHCEGTGPLAYSDPMVAPDGNTIVAMAGYAGAAIGVKVGGNQEMSGDVTAGNRLWRKTERIPQRIGTGVILGQYLYMVSEPGFQCIDIATGEEKWRHFGDGQRFWSSLVGTADGLYATSQRGDTVVFAPNPKEFTLVGTNNIGEGTNATLAMSDGEIFLRTYTHLYCIGGK